MKDRNYLNSDNAIRISLLQLISILLGLLFINWSNFKIHLDDAQNVQKTALPEKRLTKGEHRNIKWNSSLTLSRLHNGDVLQYLGISLP